MKIPETLKQPDLTALQKLCAEYMEFLISDEYHEDNDYHQFIYEAAIEALYGKDIWTFINNPKEAEENNELEIDRNKVSFVSNGGASYTCKICKHCGIGSIPYHCPECFSIFFKKVNG